MIKYIIYYYMYNSQYVCFYNDDNKMFPPNHTLSPEDEGEIKDIIYKEDLLNVFGLQEFDECHINDEIFKLYAEVSGWEELHPILDKLASKLMSTDREIGFLILFSYDYFFITHQILSEYFNNDYNIDKDKIKQLFIMVNN